MGSWCEVVSHDDFCILLLSLSLKLMWTSAWWWFWVSSPAFSVKQGSHRGELADWKKKDPGFPNQVPEEASSHLLLGAQGRRRGAEQDQLPSWSNCQETETFMVRACHISWQPLQNHSPGLLGGWVILWSVENVLDGQPQRVDIPAHARTADSGLLWKMLEENFCWIVSHVLPRTHLVKGLNLTELNSV